MARDDHDEGRARAVTSKLAHMTRTRNEGAGTKQAGERFRVGVDESDSKGGKVKHSGEGLEGGPLGPIRMSFYFAFSIVH